MKITSLLGILGGALAVGGAAIAIYFLLRKPSVPPPPPPPPEPPEGYTIPIVEKWVYKNFPNARRLSDEEAGVMEIDAGWATLSYAGGKPSNCAVQFLQNGALAYDLIPTKPDYDDLWWKITILVGRRSPISEHPYPPKMWHNWRPKDKLDFIGYVEAIALVIEPPPTDALEAEIRRAIYYNMVSDTKAPAILFYHADYGGEWLPVWADIQAFLGKVAGVDLEQFDEEISSVMVAPGHKITLYGRPNYGPPALTLAESCSNLKDRDFNDKARSVRVVRTKPAYLIDSTRYTVVTIS